MQKDKIFCFVVADSEALRTSGSGEVITEEHVSRIPYYSASDKIDAEAEEFFDLLRANIGKIIVFVDKSKSGVPLSLQEAIENTLARFQSRTE